MGLFFPFVSGPGEELLETLPPAQLGLQEGEAEKGSEHPCTEKQRVILESWGFGAGGREPCAPTAQPVTRERLPVLAELLLSVPLCFVHCTRR